MKPGDKVELAFWLSGEETESQLHHYKNVDVPAMMKMTEKVNDVVIGPLTFTTKLPGEERVPKVPDHIHGPDVRLLVCEAQVGIGKRQVVPSPGFVFDLTKKDLERLRRITRKEHSVTHPGDRLSDANCDRVIEALGPDIIYKMLKNAAN